MRTTILAALVAVALVAATALAYPPATITDITQSSVKLGGLDCGTRYEVRIREFRTGQFRDSTTQEVTTASCPAPVPAPTASFTWSPQNPSGPPVQVTFTSTGTCPATPCAYEFRHGTSNSSAVIGTGQTASFTYQTVSTKIVVLKVTDSLGRISEATNSFAVTAGAPPPPPPARCANGLDDDGDGLTDLADPGCVDANDDDESNVVEPPPSSGWPDASNTGVPPGTVLTQRSGIFVTQPGTVINAVDAPFVWVQADNVTVRNSYIHGDNLVAVYNDGGHTGLLVEDSTLAAADGSCLWGANTIGRRLDISGCENGAEGDDNLTLVDSWIHDLNTANDAHTDGVQFPGGAGNVLIRHNTINPQDSGTPATTSAIIMCESCASPPHDVRIENNKLNGDHASVSLYCPGVNTTGVYIVGNRMTRGVYGQYTASCTPGHYTEFSGNVDDVSGAPIASGG